LIRQGDQEYIGGIKMKVKLSPDQADTMWRKAVECYNSKDKNENEKAIKLANQLIEEGPVNSEISSKLNCLIADTYHHRLGNYDKAIEHYEKALNIDPKNSLAGSNMGFVYLTYKKDYASAVKVLQETLDKAVSNAFIRESTRDWLAEAKKKLG
jgi:tetratricopeptide (TPR) repeat protein